MSMWTSTPAFRTFVLCQAAALFTSVEGVCTPSVEVPAPIANGVTYMEYEKSVPAGGHFPTNANKDRDEEAIGYAAAMGATISGCAEFGDFCQDSAMAPFCPETCGVTNGPIAGIAVASPSGAGPFPLFVYLSGTGLCAFNAGPLQAMHEMVAHGFVSASIEYPANAMYDDFDEKAVTLVNGTASPVGMLCELPHVDCSLGIASAGYSQGSHLATMIHKYTHHLPGGRPAVAAALMINGGPPMNFSITPSIMMDILSDAEVSTYLPKERRRSMVMLGDAGFAPDAQTGVYFMSHVAGYDCGNDFDCLQDDGSGYVIVDNSGLTLPEHFPSMGMGWHEVIYNWTTMQFQPWFFEGPQPWTMRSGLAWLAAAATAAPGGGGEGTTCAEVKEAYRESKCCGNPGRTFSMPRGGRRLLGPAGAGARAGGLLPAVAGALARAQRSGGRAGARRLAEQILAALRREAAVV